MQGCDIHNSIAEYKHVYENAGVEPPAYRLTCKEHKALYDFLNPLIKNSMIAKYYGISIEVVMIVEPYL